MLGDEASEVGEWHQLIVGGEDDVRVLGLITIVVMDRQGAPDYHVATAVYGELLDTGTGLGDVDVSSS
jgi:hypothetical protein